MTFDELLRATVQGNAHSSATGAMYPGARASSSSRPEQSSLDISSNFSGNNDPLGGHLPDQDSGPPYTVKSGEDSKLPGPFKGIKVENLKERRAPNSLRNYLNRVNKNTEESVKNHFHVNENFNNEFRRNHQKRIDEIFNQHNNAFKNVNEALNEYQASHFTSPKSPSTVPASTSKRNLTPYHIAGAIGSAYLANWAYNAFQKRHKPQAQPIPENPKPVDASFHAVKSAGHAHDRMVERTPFPRQHVNKLQTAADILDLGPGHYYLPLRKDGELHGYAQFKSVPQRKKPVLATVLGKGMSPQGQNIEHLIKLSSIEPETNATLDKPPVTSSTYGDQLDSRPPGSTANRRAALHLGNQVSLEEGLRRAFEKLRYSDTNTVDQGSTDPEYGAQG